MTPVALLPVGHAPCWFPSPAAMVRTASSSVLSGLPPTEPSCSPRRATPLTAAWGAEWARCRAAATERFYRDTPTTAEGTAGVSPDMDAAEAAEVARVAALGRAVLAELREEGPVLEIGAGVGRLTAALARMGPVLPVEPVGRFRRAAPWGAGLCGSATAEEVVELGGAAVAAQAGLGPPSAVALCGVAAYLSDPTVVSLLRAVPAALVRDDVGTSCCAVYRAVDGSLLRPERSYAALFSAAGMDVVASSVCVLSPDRSPCRTWLLRQRRLGFESS